LRGTANLRGGGHGPQFGANSLVIGGVREGLLGSGKQPEKAPTTARRADAYAWMTAQGEKGGAAEIEHGQ
jgi:hypothetical protein